jgi:hypothetical protein
MAATAIERKETIATTLITSTSTVTIEWQNDIDQYLKIGCRLGDFHQLHLFIFFDENDNYSNNETSKRHSIQIVCRYVF